MEVRRISPKDTKLIRKKMLRPEGTLEDCSFEGDSADQTFHLGAFVDGKLVSIASFFFEKHPEIEGPHQYRLRGMATLPEFQNQGLSMALLKRGLPIIRQNLCTVLWCNARKTAVGFYEKNGFTQKGDFFEIEGIGQHLLMVRDLNN